MELLEEEYNEIHSSDIESVDFDIQECPECRYPVFSMQVVGRLGYLLGNSQCYCDRCHFSVRYIGNTVYPNEQEFWRFVFRIHNLIKQQVKPRIFSDDSVAYIQFENEFVR